MAAAASVLLCLASCSPRTAPSSGSPSAQKAEATPASGPVLFEEVSQKVGLRFQHDSGSRGMFGMPEHIGSGAALFDYDNDGRLDIYLVQCGGDASGSANRLFHQEPDRTFKDVSVGSGLDVQGIGMGAIAGDVNNDGWTDVFVTEYGRVRLLLNRAGRRFEEVTTAAGIENTRWATAASFLDYDRDGWLDLVVGNYVDYLPTQQCFDPAGLPDFCGPQNFQTTASRLFRNRGSDSPAGTVTFEDVTVRSGLAKAQGKALGVLCRDFDGDRWVDIFIADDGVANRLYLNRHDGTFVEEAALRGLAFNAMGATAGNMGIGVGDINGDGLFDLFVTHLTHEQHALWIQSPRGLFQDRTAASGLASLRQRGTGFGTVAADLDLDGWCDLAIVNGTIRRGSAHAGPPLAGLIPFWYPYAQHYQLFLNDGQGRLLDVSAANDAFCGFIGIGRGLAQGDLNDDGAIDLLAVCAGGPAQLFLNRAARRGHWLGVRALDPTRGGRDAIGAEVELVAGQRHWHECIQPSSSYLVSNDPRAHFGLGAMTRLDALRLTWPDGTEEEFAVNAVDRHLVVRKGEGRAVPSNAANPGSR